jgi:hypothetical protein
MVKRRARTVAEMDPRLRHEAVAFLRAWLPERVKSVYRALIEDGPEGWRAHPHFAGGVIVDHVFRGNGLTEEALGVEDLNKIWPELLQLALSNEPPPAPELPTPEPG